MNASTCSRVIDVGAVGIPCCPRNWTNWETLVRYVAIVAGDARCALRWRAQDTAKPVSSWAALECAAAALALGIGDPYDGESHAHGIWYSNGAGLPDRGSGPSYMLFLSVKSSGCSAVR